MDVSKLEADARRYRWMRQASPSQWDDIYCGVQYDENGDAVPPREEQIDALVDAAMKTWPI